MPDFDAIVVGSGAGGLSAALTVAKSGRSVLLLEAMRSFGGYLNPFYRRGYAFDTGLHYVGALGETERFGAVLKALGIRESLEFVPLDPDGFDILSFPDYEFSFCTGRERLKARLISEFPQEERGILRFFQVLDKVTRAMVAARSVRSGPLGMMGFLLKHPVMLRYARAPYQQLLDEITDDLRLKAVLAGQCGTYALPPERASILIALMVLDYFNTGAYFPKGGSGALRDTLLDALRNHQVELQSGARVSRIERQADAFVVGTEAGELFSARAVVSNAEPAITLGQLADPTLVPAKVRAKAVQIKPSLGTFCAFVGTDLDLPAQGLTSGNIHHFESLDVNEVYGRLNLATLEERAPFCYITSSSVKDPEGGHAPAGHHTVTLLTASSYDGLERWAHLPSMDRGDAYETLKARIGQGLITVAERYIPGLSQHIKVVEYASPLTNASWVNAVQGGMVGPEHSPGQVGQGRYSSCTSGIEGLFLAGSGTIGGGVAACMASGLVAGRKAVAHLGDGID